MGVVMWKLFSLSLFVLSFLLTGPVVAQEDSRDDTSFSDGYNLYDRNREGLDWNRYNYPNSGRNRTER